jgi:dipeptidase D
VESSLNLGVIVQDQQIHFEYLIRSCVGSKRDFIVNQLKALSALIHAKYQIFGSYDAWEYNSQSKIRDVVVKVFKEKYKKEPEIKAIHAGLECGILGGKMGDGSDMVSIGPNLFDVHSPDEKMDIKSAQNTWESLLEILKLTKDFY